MGSKRVVIVYHAEVDASESIGEMNVSDVLIREGTTLLGSTATPALALPAGTTSPYFVSGYGDGSGTGGFVVIVPAIGSSSTQIGVSATLYSL